MPRSWCGRPRPSDERGQRGEAQEPEEISCSECFDLLSAGVELELAGATWEPGLTRLGRHLGQCRVCRDEYETLRDFVRFEAEKPTLPPDSTSPVPECSARKIPLESDT
jgi:predicted anti-sigma-YlaC factor YlaD